MKKAKKQAKKGPYKAIGSLIRSARINLERSQLWLAAELGVKHQMISSIENGISRIPENKLTLIKNALGVTDSQILDCFIEAERTRVMEILNGGLSNAKG